MLERLKQLPPVASALVLKPRKVDRTYKIFLKIQTYFTDLSLHQVVTGKKKSRNLIKAESKEGLIPGSGGVVVAGAGPEVEINKAKYACH